MTNGPLALHCETMNRGDLELPRIVSRSILADMLHFPLFVQDWVGLSRAGGRCAEADAVDSWSARMLRCLCFALRRACF